MEIGNSVFMEYIKKTDGTFESLPQRNVDFGAGLERITAAKNNTQDVFVVDVFSNIIQHLEVASGKRYENEKLKQSFRVIADHMRAAIFMIADGVTPSNTDQGYALRRLIRRSMVKLRQLEISNFPLGSLVSVVVADYPDYFGKPQQIERHINGVITTEEARFGLTLEKGLREFAKVSKNDIAGHDAFALFATYGFPLEVILELTRERNISVDVDGFNKEMREHQVKSRAGAEQKFKGGLADEGEKTVALHTATHLLLAGLRKYVGNHVHQAGSNITTERARFDFTHTEKVGREVLDQVEVYVNEAIQKGCTVAIEEMPKEEAKQKEAEGSFWEKYPDVVKVYKVVAPDGTVYSQELCGGPHVKNTGVLGHFKIVKEEAVSAGVRRIKAVLE
jgi:alanyl-tRNA synthetase